jgi:hypothetical protein
LFTNNEHINLMNKIDFPFDILKANLYNILDAYIEFEPSNDSNTDGLLKIGFDGRKAIDLEYVIINNKTNPTFERLYGMYLMTNNIVFIADNFSTLIKNELKANGIQYIELNGNCFIKIKDTFIYVIGNKKISTKKAPPNRAFSKTGLKIILYYLTEENNINMPSRDLARHLQIGYSNIHYVTQGLRELKYLIPKNKNIMVLDNKKELLKRWISNYEEKIKPTLLEGRFKFGTEVGLKNWRNLKTETNFQWGGEAAAALLTNNFEPKIFSIYTDEPKSGLIKKYKLIPDKDGYIFVYKPLHSFYTSHYLNATHPIIIYADLIISQESRNIEVANKIYEKFIQY